MAMSLKQKRLMSLLSTCWRLLLLALLVMLMTFILLSISPIDPVIYYAGDKLFSMNSLQTEVLSSNLGLNVSLFERFGQWFQHLLQGELGFSISQQLDVSTVLQQRAPHTFRLMLMGWSGALLLGYSCGIVAAFYHKRLLGRCIDILCWLTASSPAFWIAILALSFFAVYLQWVPVCCGAPIGVNPNIMTWSEQLPYLLLPSLVLAISGMGNIAIHTREKARQVLDSDHVLYARMHGKKGWHLYQHHLFRNTVTPALVLQLASLSEFLGGSALIETVFNFPGIGMTTVSAGLNGDIALLMSITMCATLLVFCGNSFAHWISGYLLAKGRSHV